MTEFIASTIMAIGAIIFGSVALVLATTATDSIHFTAARVCLFIGIALLTIPILILTWTANYSVAVRAVSLGLISAATIVSLFLSIVWFDDLEVKNTPKLFAGDAADPVQPACGPIPDNALKTFFGSNLAWSTRFPHTVLRMKGVDVLVVDQDKSGALIIKTLKVFDKDGNSIARFDDGEMWNSGEIRTKRPDKSTLIVYDKSDTEIMRVKFTNPKTIEVTGTFFYPSAPPVLITDSKMAIGGMTMTGNCFGNSGTDIVVN